MLGCFNLDFYVYIYLDPRKKGNFSYGPYKFDCEPFYVGKGSNGRMYEHVFDCNLNNNKNKFKNSKIKKIHNINLKPTILKLEELLTEYESLEIEKWLIKLIGRADLGFGPLTNLTDGGDGNTGWVPSKEVREKISKKNKGLCRSKEVKQKMSESRKGKLTGSKNPMWGAHISEEEKLKKSLATKGIKKSKDIVDKRVKSLCKKTYKIISPENKIYFTNNLNEFCRELNLGYSTMYTVSSGKHYSHKGWIVYIVGQENLRKDIEERHKKQNQKLKRTKHNIIACSPEGVFYDDIINIKNFCEENKLKYKKIVENYKTGFCNGWTFFNK